MAEADEGEASPSLTARLTGRSVVLRPPGPGDYPFLFELLTHPANLIRFRLAGGVPSPEAFPQAVWAGVLVQFIVHGEQDHGPIGLVTAYNADHRHGFVYISAVFHPDLAGAGWPLESLFVLRDHLFRCWPFRKIYLETTVPNYEQFASGEGVIFHTESRLRQHCYVDGQYVDFLTLAVYRDDADPAD